MVVALFGELLWGVTLWCILESYFFMRCHLNRLRIGYWVLFCNQTATEYHTKCHKNLYMHTGGYVFYYFAQDCHHSNLAIAINTVSLFFCFTTIEHGCNISILSCFWNFPCVFRPIKNLYRWGRHLLRHFWGNLSPWWPFLVLLTKTVAE